MRTELASPVPSTVQLLDLNKHQDGEEKEDQGADPPGGVLSEREVKIMAESRARIRQTTYFLFPCLLF